MFDLRRASSAQLRDRPLLLVPLGATEQHGAHLPVTTDSIVAAAVAEQVAARLPDPVALAPVIAFGSSGEHAGFAGTISIGQDALGLVLIEAVRSVADWAGSVVVVNAHGGNLSTLSHVVPQLRDEGHAVGWVPCAVPGGDAHAGRTETSLLLHLAPDDVRLELAEPGNPRPIHELLTELQAGGVRAVAPNGVLGDPRGATAAEGARLLEEMVANVLARFTSGVIDERGCFRVGDRC